MRKPISRQAHGLVDYAYASMLSTSPEWAGYQEERRALLLSRLLSAGALTYTLCTRAEWGLFRILPFRVHLAIDLPAAALTALAPWLLGFSHHRPARNTFLGIGLFGCAVTLLTRPEEQPA